MKNKNYQQKFYSNNQTARINIQGYDLALKREFEGFCKDNKLTKLGALKQLLNIVKK